jgi:hypothetical protein
MMVQEGVGGVLQRRYAAGESYDLPHRGALFGCRSKRGQFDIPPSRDSPGPAVVDTLLPQQIGALPPQPRVGWQAQRLVRARMASSASGNAG